MSGCFLNCTRSSGVMRGVSEKGIEYISDWEYISKNRLSFRDIALLLSAALAFLFSMSFVILLPFMGFGTVLVYDISVAVLVAGFLLLARKRQINRIGWYELAITGKSLEDEAILGVIRDVLRDAGYVIEERRKLLGRHIIPDGADFSIHAYVSGEVALIRIGPRSRMNEGIIGEIRQEIRRKIVEPYDH